jgi:hypothetical protein
MSEAPACLWCRRPFRLRRSGGHAQKFCRPACRRRYHAAARSWALNAIEIGGLTIADIKTVLMTTRALPVGMEEPTPMRSRSALVSLTVLPVVVDELRRLGWVTNGGLLNDKVCDAIVELVERAIALGLRPS